MKIFVSEVVKMEEMYFLSLQPKIIKMFEILVLLEINDLEKSNVEVINLNIGHCFRPKPQHG